MRKERLKLEKQEHGRIKKIGNGTSIQGKFEIERLQVEKLRFENEAKIKCTGTKRKAKENNQQDSG